MYIKTILIVSTLAACQALPKAESPPCDEASLAALLATCSDEADCNKKLDDRHATCAKRIKED